MKAFKTLGLVFKIGYSKAQDQDLKGSKKKRAKSKKGSIMSFTGSIVVLGRSKDAG